MSKIIWLHYKSFSSAQRSMLENYMRRVKLDPAGIFFISMHMRVQGLQTRKGKSQKIIANTEKKQEFFDVLDEYLERTQADVIVVNDIASLELLTGYQSLDLCRGSVYRYNGKPVIVVDDVLKTKSVKYAAWVLMNDLLKVKRWAEDDLRSEPKFSYTVCRSVSDLDRMREYLLGCLLISRDIETAGSPSFITCDGFTGIHTDGTMHSWVVPFYNPLKDANAHWDTEEEEIYAWKTIHEINDSDIPKVFQNGQYDCAYQTRYRIPPRNYFYDTLHMWHSFWAEAPKKLNFITSIAVDHCRYWKDESKGEQKDKDKNLRVPADPVGLEMYWRYNALDCHNTALSARWIMIMMAQESNKWARDNYVTEFSLQVGPAMAMTMRGMRCNRKRLLRKDSQWQKEHKQALKDLRIMCDDDEFNPFSPQQVASLLYDVLGAQPIKKRGQKKAARSADEKMLKLIRTQHPVYAAYIDKIWEAKKTSNNSAKYGSPEKLLYRPSGRFMYGLSAAGTETGRFASKGHHFWIGTNAQNIPGKSRDMFVADPGYILCEADYSQSDAYFVAFESEDQAYMQNITDDRDTHAVHAEFFFKVPYEKIMANLKTDWISHPITGIRSNTKRVVHGSNYRMAAYTLYITMGREAVVASAKAVGHADAHLWDESKLVQFCDMMLRAYLKLYPRLPMWFIESVQEAVKNGNRATCAFGRTRQFFGNLANDDKLQRELSAYFGQGGTAGNINRTLLDVYYKSGLEQEGLMLLNQVHDSILFQVPVEKIDLIKKFLTIMEQPCIVRGREFTVPAEAEVGFSWKGSFVEFSDDFTIEDAIEAEEKLNAKYE